MKKTFILLFVVFTSTISLAQTTAKRTKEAKKQLQREKKLEAEPVLLWLKQNNYAPEGAKTISKAQYHMLVALNDQKELIADLVKNKGDNINKSTSLKEMIRLFKKYDMCATFLCATCAFMYLHNN